MSSRARDNLKHPDFDPSSHGSSERISFGTGSTGSRSGSQTSGSSSRFKRRLINAMNRASLYALVQQAETTFNNKVTFVGLLIELFQWIALTINSQFRGDAVVFSNTGVFGKILYFFLFPLYDASYVGGIVSLFSNYRPLSEYNENMNLDNYFSSTHTKQKSILNQKIGAADEVNFILASVVFWICVSLALLFVMGSLNALFSEHQQLSRRVRLFVSTIVHPLGSWALVPLVGNLTSFLVCDVTDNQLFWYPQFSCSEPMAIAYFVFGAFALFFFVFVAWLVDTMLIDDVMVSKALKASAHSHVSELFLLGKVALVILFHVLNAKGFPLVYHCCVAAVGVFLSLCFAFMLPFYRSEVNRFFSAITLGGGGLAFAAVIMVSRSQSSKAEASDVWYSDTNIGPAVGIILSFYFVFAIVGAFLPSLRVDSYYSEGIDQLKRGILVKDERRRYPKGLPKNDLLFSPHRGIESAFLQKVNEENELMEMYRRQQKSANHQHGSISPRDIEMRPMAGGAADDGTGSEMGGLGCSAPRFLLTLLRPFISRVYVSSDVEVAGRVLDTFSTVTGQSPPETMVAYVARIYTKGLAKYRSAGSSCFTTVHLGVIHLHFTQLLLFHAGKQRAALAESEEVLRLCYPSFTVAFRATRLQTQLRNYLNHSDAASLKVLTSSLRLHKEILGHVSLFWQKLLTQQNVDTIQLANIANMITTRRAQALEQFQRVLQNPNRKLMLYYARFLEQVMMDTRRASIIRKRIDEETELRRQQQLNGTRVRQQSIIQSQRGGGVGGGMGIAFWDATGELFGGSDGADDFRNGSGIEGPSTVGSSTAATGSPSGGAGDRGASTSSGGTLRNLTTIMLAMFCLLSTVVIGFFLYEHFRTLRTRQEMDRFVTAARQRSILPLAAFHTEQLRACLMGSLLTINAVDKGTNISFSPMYTAMLTIFNNDTAPSTIVYSVDGCSTDNIKLWQHTVQTISTEHYALHQSLTTGSLAISNPKAKTFFSSKRIEINVPSFDGRSLSGMMQRDLTDMWSLGNELASHLNAVASFNFSPLTSNLRRTGTRILRRSVVIPTAVPTPSSQVTDPLKLDGSDFIEPFTTPAPTTAAMPTAPTPTSTPSPSSTAVPMPSQTSVAETHRSMLFVIMNVVPNIVPSYDMLLEMLEEEGKDSHMFFFWIATGLFAAAEIIVFIVYALVLTNFQRIGVQKLSALSLFTLIPRTHLEKLLDKSRERFDLFDVNDEGDGDREAQLGPSIPTGMYTTQNTSNQQNAAGGAAAGTEINQVQDPQLMSATTNNTAGSSNNNSNPPAQQFSFLSPDKVAREHRLAQKNVVFSSAGTLQSGGGAAPQQERGGGASVDAFLTRAKRSSHGGARSKHDAGDTASEHSSDNDHRSEFLGTSSDGSDSVLSSETDDDGDPEDMVNLRGGTRNDEDGDHETNKNLANRNGKSTSKSSGQQRRRSRIVKYLKRTWRWLMGSSFSVVLALFAVLLCATLVGLLYSLDGTTRQLVKQQDALVTWTESSNDWYDKFTKCRTATILFLASGSEEAVGLYFSEWESSSNNINSLYSQILSFEENTKAIETLQSIRSLLDAILLRQLIAIWLVSEANRFPVQYQHILERIGASERFLSYNMTVLKPTLDAIFTSFAVKPSPAPASATFTDRNLPRERQLLVARSLIFDDMYIKHWSRVEELRHKLKGETSVGKDLPALREKHKKLFIGSIAIASVSFFVLLFMAVSNRAQRLWRFSLPGLVGGVFGSIFSIAIIVVSIILFLQVEDMVKTDNIKDQFTVAKNTTLTAIPATLHKSRVFLEFGDKTAFHDYFANKDNDAYYSNYADIIDQLAFVGATEDEIRSVFSTVSLLRSRTERVLHFGDIAVLLSAWSYYGVNSTGGRRGDGLVTSPATSPIDRELFQAVNVDYNLALELSMEKDTLQSRDPLYMLYTNNTFDSLRRPEDQKLIARATLGSTRFRRHWSAFKGNAEQFLDESWSIIDRIATKQRAAVYALSSVAVYIAAALLILILLVSMYSIFDILQASFAVSDLTAAGGFVVSSFFNDKRSKSSGSPSNPLATSASGFGASNSDANGLEKATRGATITLNATPSPATGGGGNNNNTHYSIEKVVGAVGTAGGGGSKAVLLTEIAVRSRVALVLIAVVFACLYAYDVAILESLKDIPHTINMASSLQSELTSAACSAQRIFNNNRSAFATPLSVEMKSRVKKINVIRDHLYVGAVGDSSAPYRSHEHSKMLFGSIGPTRIIATQSDATASAASSLWFAGGSTASNYYSNDNTGAVPGEEATINTSPFSSSAYSSSKYSSECTSTIINGNDLLNLVSFASSNRGAIALTSRHTYSSLARASDYLQRLKDAAAAAASSTQTATVPQPISSAIPSFADERQSDLWQALVVNGVEDLVGQLLFVFETMGGAVDRVFISAVTGQPQMPRSLVSNQRQRYERSVSMVTNPLNNELQRSTNMYVDNAETYMNNLSIGHYCTAAATLSLIMLIFLFVLRPMLAMLAKEDDGTRLLLKMIPAEVRREVPAVAEYLEFGTITQNLKLQRIADISKELSTDCLVVINEHGIIEHVSSATLDEFGYKSTNEMIGKNVKLIMPEHVARYHDEYLRRYHRTGVRSVLDRRRRVTAMRADGSTFVAEIIIREMLGSQLASVGLRSRGSSASSSYAFGSGFFGLIRNVTVEVKLENAQRMNEAVAEMCTDPIVVIDPRGVITRCNSAAFHTFGFSAHELLGKNVSFLMPSAVGDKHDSYLDAYRTDRKPSSIINKVREVTAIRKGGEKFVSQLTVKELLDDSGQIECYIGFFKDMSTSIRIAQAGMLNESVIAMSPTPVIGFLPTGEITRFSPSACDALGFTTAEVIGRDISQLLLTCTADEGSQFMHMRSPTSIAPGGGVVESSFQPNSGNSALNGALRRHASLQTQHGKSLASRHTISAAEFAKGNLNNIIPSPLSQNDEFGPMVGAAFDVPPTFPGKGVTEDSTGSPLSPLKFDGSALPRVAKTRRQTVRIDGNNDVNNGFAFNKQAAVNAESALLKLVRHLKEFQRGLQLQQQQLVSQHESSANNTGSNNTDSDSEFQQQLEQLMNTPVPPVRLDARTRDGLLMPVSIHVHEVSLPDSGSGGCHTEYIAFLQDNRDELTHRKAAHMTAVLFQSSPVPLITADEDANILSCNSAAEKLVGYRKAQLVGSSAKMLMEARLATEHDAFVARFKANPNNRKIVDNRITINVRRGDGKVLPVEVMLRFVNQDSLMGKRRVFYLSMKDGTDATKLQEATGLSEAIGQLYTVPMISITTTGVIVSYNVAAQATFGYTEKEVIGRNVKILMPDEIAVRHDDYLKNYSVTRQASMIGQRRVINYKHKSGEIRPAEIQIQEVNREDGETLYVSYLKDVRKDLVLESAASIATVIIDSSPLPIIIINSQGRVIRFSRAASQVLQWREEDIVGKNVKVLMQHDVAKVHDRYVRNYIRTGVRRMIGTTRQVMAMRKDGMAINVEVSVKETRRSELLHDYSNQIRVSSIDIFVPIDSRTSGSSTSRSSGGIMTAAGFVGGGGGGSGGTLPNQQHYGSAGMRLTSTGAVAGSHTMTGSDPFSGSGRDGTAPVAGSMLDLAGQHTGGNTNAGSQSSNPGQKNYEEDDILFIGYIHDLSHEYILRQSNELRDVILYESSIPIIQLDMEGRITFANPALALEFSYSPEELVGHDAMVLVPDTSGQQASFLSRFKPTPASAHHAKDKHANGVANSNNNSHPIITFGDMNASTNSAGLGAGSNSTLAPPLSPTLVGGAAPLHALDEESSSIRSGSATLKNPNSGEEAPTSFAPIEAVARRRDGTEFPVEVHVREIVINKVKTYFSYLRNVEQLRLVKDEKLVGDTIIKHSSIPLIILNDRGIISEFNPSAEEVFGYKSRDVVGRSVGILQPPQNPRAHMMRRMMPSMDFGGPILGASTAANVGGSIQNAAAAAAAQRESMSSNSRHIGMSRLSSATGASSSTNASRKSKMPGAPDSEDDDEFAATVTVTNADGSTSVVPNPREIFLDRLLQSKKLKHPVDVTYRIKAMKRDGSVFPMEVTLKEIVPAEGQEGAPVVYVAYAKDFSKEDSVESAQALADAISSISQTPFVCVNRHGAITMFSKAAEEEFGYTASEIIGQDVSVLQLAQDTNDASKRLGVSSSTATAAAASINTNHPSPPPIGTTTYGGATINQYSLKSLMRSRTASFVPEVHGRLIGKRKNGTTFTMDVDVRHFDESSGVGGVEDQSHAGTPSSQKNTSPSSSLAAKRNGSGAALAASPGTTTTVPATGESRFFNYAAAACLRNVTEEVDNAINSSAYSKIVELTGAPLVIINEKGIIETCNAALEETYGYSAKELIGRNVKVLMLPEVAAHHDEYLESYLETGVKKVLDQHRRVYSITKQQRIILTELFVLEMVTPQLNKRNFYGFLRDLTQQLSLHQAFSLSDAITDLSPVPIIAIDAKGTILKFSAASSKLFEYEANGEDGVVGRKNVSILMRPQDAALHDGFLLSAKNRGYVGAARKVVGVSKTGRLISLELTISPVMHGKQVMSYVGFLRDMTTQDKLESDRQISREIAAFSKQPIIVINYKGIIETINKHALQLFGYANETQCVGRNVSMLMPAEIGVHHDNFINTFLRNGRAKRVLDTIRTVTAVGSRGESIVIDIGVKELQVPGSEPKFLAFIHTVSEQLTRQESVAFNEALLSLTPMAFVLADATGRMIQVSEVACHMFGYGRNEVVNNNVRMLMPSSVAALHDTYLANYIHSGVKKIIDVPVRVAAVRRDGKQFDVTLEVKEIVGKDGQRFFAAFFKESTITPSATTSTVGGLSNNLSGGLQPANPIVANPLGSFSKRQM